MFEGPYHTGLASRYYDYSSDRDQFLMIREGIEGDEELVPPHLVLVENWFEYLKERAPVP